MAERRLGKRPYVRDPRSLRLADYLTDAAPPPPAEKNWSDAVSAWHMYLNNEIGDCTVASAAHLIELWTAAGQHYEATVTDAEVLGAYSTITGYNSADPATDQGAEVVQVLRYWQQTGIADHRIGAYAEVDPADHTRVKQAIDLFGGVDVGLQLPAAAQTFTAPQWPTPPSTVGEWQPGSWGGHCVPAVDYTVDGPTVVSWGELVVVAWAFWDAYVDECWAIITPDFLDAGVTPEGLDLAALEADLAAVRQ